MQRYFCSPPAEARRLLDEIEPSTKGLVHLLFFVTKAVVERLPFPGAPGPLFPRLMVHSFLDDGAFARLHFAQSTQLLAQAIIRCIAAARLAGELIAEGEDDELLFWFCYHTLIGINLHHLPPTPIVPYHSETTKLTEPVMRYMLRGIGLTPQATKTYVDFAELTAQVEQWLLNAGKGTG